MPKSRLTQAAVDALKPRSKPYAVTDPEVANHRVHVSVKGRVIFQLRKNGTMLTLGSSPEITLANARRIALGGVPMPVKADCRPIEHWIATYVATDAAHLVSGKRRGQILRKMLDTILGETPDAITRPYLIEKCNRLQKEGMKGTTVHGYRTVVTMFVHWLVSKNVVQRTPLTTLPRIPQERQIKFLDAAGMHMLERFCLTYPDVQLLLLCHKLSFCALGGTALACTCWQHGQRGRRRAKSTVRRRRIEMIDNGLWRSGRIGMPSRPLVRG